MRIRRRVKKVIPSSNLRRGEDDRSEVKKALTKPDTPGKGKCCYPAAWGIKEKVEK